MWYEFKNSSTVKNSVALFKMASVKKTVKSKGAVKKWPWWYKLIANILTIRVNLVLIPSDAGVRQHKLKHQIFMIPSIE